MQGPRLHFNGKVINEAQALFSHSARATMFLYIMSDVILKGPKLVNLMNQEQLQEY